MTRADLEFLLSARGREVLTLARDLGTRDPVVTLSALRRRCTPEEAAAAFEQIRLRERARAKFALADAMLLEREALEQATGERIARWRARRFAGREWVADLCCGLGGDALALAKVARVVAVDRDLLRLFLLRENARVYGVAERIAPLCGLVPGATPRVTAAFADPSRRRETRGGERRRTLSLAAMSPPLEALLSLAQRVPDLGIKLSPALDDAELEAAVAGRPHELEFISDGGECREAVLWLGGLVTAARRATVLPAGETRAVETHGPGGATTGRVGAYLYDPDPAVVRAHGVELLAEELGAWKLDPWIAYLSSDRLVATPLAAGYVVREAMPFHLRRVAEALSMRGYADVVIKKRGFPAEPEKLRRQILPRLRGGSGSTAILFLARAGDRHLAIVAEPAPRPKSGAWSDRNDREV